MGVDIVDITAKRAALTPNAIAFEDALTGRTLTYAELDDRAARVAAVLATLGVAREDRVAILCRNRIEFFEILFACGKLGAILVPLNWRAPATELASIMADCTPRTLVFGQEDAATAQSLVHADLALLALDDGYDAVLAAATPMPTDPRWPGDAVWSLSYTSGTTGDPKGVLYSHRSNILHTMIGLQKDAIGIGAADTTLPVVPMFHANAWGLAFSGPATGSKLVLPGAKMDGESIYELLDGEKVTFTAAVPTVWLMLLQYLEQTGKKLPHLKRVVIGGSAVPERILRAFEENYEVEVVHAWGMTEMSPLGSLGSMTENVLAQDRDTIVKYKLKQGRPPFGVEMKTINDEGVLLPRDGKTAGRLVVRGPAVAKAYFKGAGGQILDEHGFFDTGDVANLDEYGYMQITDRAKDVIKSGGEWISSIDIENFAVGHPAVANAAAIGLPHPKWDERPLLIIEPKERHRPRVHALAGSHGHIQAVPERIGEHLDFALHRSPQYRA